MIKLLDFSCFAVFFLFFILFPGELSRVLVGCVQYPDDTWSCTIVTIGTPDHNDNSAKISLVEASIGRAFRWSEEHLEKHTKLFDHLLHEVNAACRLQNLKE